VLCKVCAESPVIRHPSHVTRHTSHVTRHTSHVTRHTSHVTRHTSHVTPPQHNSQAQRLPVASLGQHAAPTQQRDERPHLRHLQQHRHNPCRPISHVTNCRPPPPPPRHTQPALHHAVAHPRPPNAGRHINRSPVVSSRLFPLFVFGIRCALAAAQLCVEQEHEHAIVGGYCAQEPR
jgi:hypothetical protein